MDKILGLRESALSVEYDEPSESSVGLDEEEDADFGSHMRRYFQSIKAVYVDDSMLILRCNSNLVTSMLV